MAVPLLAPTLITDPLITGYSFGLAPSGCFRPTERVHQERDPDQEHKKRQELPARERAGQWGVWLSEELPDYSHGRVQQKETAGRYPVWLSKAEPDRDQAHEKQEPFKRRFVKLAWVSRDQNIAKNFSDLRISTSCGDNCFSGINRRNRAQSGIEGQALADRRLAQVRVID